MKLSVKVTHHSVISDSLQTHGLYGPWNSPGQNTEVGNLPLSRGSSQPRDLTQVSSIASGFFNSWATREAIVLFKSIQFYVWNHSYDNDPYVELGGKNNKNIKFVFKKLQKMYDLLCMLVLKWVESFFK